MPKVLDKRIRRSSTSKTVEPHARLPGQYATLCRELAKSASRNAILWIVALVVLWWTIEIYAVDTRKKLNTTRVELDRAQDAVERNAAVKRELTKKLDAFDKKDSKSTLTKAEAADARTSLKAINEDAAKLATKLESADQAFAQASLPELIAFKLPVPGLDQLRISYALAPVLLATLVVGVFAYLCVIRWQVFEFAARAFCVAPPGDKLQPIDETLAPAAWWIFPVPEIDSPSCKAQLRILFGVSSSTRGQYPSLLWAIIAALLALQFRVSQLSDDIHVLVDPDRSPIVAVSARAADSTLRSRIDARQMDNSLEALAPVVSECLLALNLSLAAWWLWPRRLSLYASSQLQPTYTRRAAIGFSAALSLALGRSFILHTRLRTDAAISGMRRSASRLHLIRNPRHRRRRSRHTPVSLKDGLYLHTKSQVIHVVSNHLWLEVGAFNSIDPKHAPVSKPPGTEALIPLTAGEALRCLESSTIQPPARGPRTTSNPTLPRRTTPPRLHGTATSFVAELATLGRFGTEDETISAMLMACIKRDFDVKKRGDDRVSAGRRKKPRQRNRDRLALEPMSHQTVPPPTHDLKGDPARRPLRISLRLYDLLVLHAEHAIGRIDSRGQSEKSDGARVLKQMTEFLRKMGLSQHYDEHRERQQKVVGLRPKRGTRGASRGAWFPRLDA